MRFTIKREEFLKGLNVAARLLETTKKALF